MINQHLHSTLKVRLLAEFSLFLSFLVLLGCAAQGPPSGGPEDKTPPVLLLVAPQDGSTNVPPDATFEFYFNEAIEARSTVGTLQVYPEPPGAPQIKVRKKRITVGFVEPLEENTTYILNFGHSIQDYRKNNSVEEVKLAFSTGDSLDQGSIAGRIFDLPKEYNAVVRAYRGNADFTDTLHTTKPDYQAAINRSGEYTLGNLAEGKYRVIAIASKSPRINFIGAEDLIGLPPTDPLFIRNRRDRVSGLNFRLGKQYLEPFGLKTVAVNAGRIEVNFNQPLKPESVSGASFSLDNQPLADVQPRWIDPEQSSRLLLIPQDPEAGREYRLRVAGVKSLAGDLQPETEREYPFTWRAVTDTIGPRLFGSRPKNAAADIPLNSPIELTFSEAVRGDTLERDVTFWKNDSIALAGLVQWTGGNLLRLVPEAELVSDTDYKLVVDSHDWTDYYGNPCADSTFTLRFRTVDVEKYGSLAGRVTMNAGVDLQGIRIEAVSATDAKSAGVASADSSGVFEIRQLLPGEYTLNVWEERGGSDQYDYGKLIPFTIAEPFRNYPRSIELRSRWATEGIILEY